MNLFKNIFGSTEPERANSKVNWRALTDIGQLNEIVNESSAKPVIIFKHSTRCGISRMTLKQFENEYELEDLVTPYFLDLLENRDISNEVAKRFDIEHQSPQLILIKNGRATYNASHSDIYADALKRYI
ncbi:bacillithiol system redox-active protein YtxJ [Flavobacterium sp. J49]|uniref:bacillithiol system redox-active protein YtxJ n=1 Tax=Flavobacterium sp. J49 TaxID=2718534 RepID=UPI00159452BE|nr:bacillithiol system redox-active protein YtxJ [Flavobacterium sp. J49]MBF6642068.1 bacillithiol system redox-active protein YtxJ [Flavobacterium sp. J49]NIC03316.1 bacillithiol system redox-active protein YtxJ [Flavobacterium sp. J49]